MSKARYDYLQKGEPAEQRPTEQEVPGQPEVTVMPEVLAHPSNTLNAARSAMAEPGAYALPPQRKGKRLEPGLKRTDVPREQLNVRIRPELKRAAAGLAGLQGKTLGDVVEAALIEYLKNSK